jgi:hypothetical protein
MCEDYYTQDEQDAWTRTLERTRESQRTIRSHLNDLDDRQAIIESFCVALDRVEDERPSLRQDLR